MGQGIPATTIRTYGITQVLNINQGTILLGYMMYRLGVDIQFKISVFVGNDNPYFILWTLMTARLFCREDGTTPLVGFNLSNSVNNETIRQANTIRKQLGLENRSGSNIILRKPTRPS
jgi:hypothetical protein